MQNNHFAPNALLNIQRADEEVLQKLAKQTILEYERVREDVARIMGIPRLQIRLTFCLPRAVLSFKLMPMSVNADYGH